MELENHTRLQQDGRWKRAVHAGIVGGLTPRNYHRAVESLLEGYGIEKSSMSPEFVQANAARLRKLCGKTSLFSPLKASYTRTAGTATTLSVLAGYIR